MLFMGSNRKLMEDEIEDEKEGEKRMRKGRAVMSRYPTIVG